MLNLASDLQTAKDIGGNMNEELLKGKWKEIKGEIQNTWGKLTNDELEKAQGNATSITGLIQQRYGIAKEEAGRKLNEIISRFGNVVDRKSEVVKDNLRENNREEELKKPA